MPHAPAARLTLAALIVVALVGCGDGEGNRTTKAKGSPSTTAAPTTSPSASAHGVPEASIEPATVVAQSEWLTATVDIPYPDGLAAFGEHVFVKTDDGHVVRVDAVSGEVVDDVRVDTSTDSGHYCQGIGSDGKTLWACSAGLHTTEVYRLDPDSLDVTEKVPVDKLFDQLSLPVVAGKVWVLAGSGDRLTAIDTATGKTRTTKLGRRCFQLAATETSVYATCLLTDELVAVDAVTGKVTATAEVPNPTNVSVAGDGVWVSGGGGVLRLSTDLEPRLLFPGLTAGQEGDLVAAADAVWVRQAEGFLFRIDPAAGTVAAQYAIDPVPSGGSVLVTDAGVWLSAYDDNTIYRLDPAAG
jgi:streptogramin lyase